MIRQGCVTVMVAWLASAVVLTIGAPAAGAATQSFKYIGAAQLEQQFTVPAGVSSVDITAIGGQGGGNDYDGRPGSPSIPGRGARITGTVAVTPGQVLYVEVAAAGNSGMFCCTNNPGGGGRGGTGFIDSRFNLSGGGGGGASDVRTIPSTMATTLASRVIVAAGGGGSGGYGTPGGDAGAPGGICSDCDPSGSAGTPNAGGVGGAAGGSSYSGQSGSPGVLGNGGNGGSSNARGSGGGGGGGGLYGGGAGGSGFNGGGGGGGSSYAPGGATAEPTSEPASITFTYVVGAATSPGTTPPGTTPPGTGLELSRSSISELRLSRSFFRAARSGSSTVTQMVAGLPRVSYSLNAAARVRFGVERATIGRRVGGRCMTTSPTNRKRTRCTRFVTLSGTFTRDRPEGDDSFTLTGRLAGRTLNPGNYRLLATPIAGGRSGLTRRAAFRITTR